MSEATPSPEEQYAYLMNISTVLYLLCYVPDLYANYKNKNANLWNVPEKVILFFGTTFSLAYVLLIRDDALILNYVPLFALDALSLGMRSYYAYRNWRGAQPPYAPQIDDAGSGVRDVKSSPVDSNRGSNGPLREATGTDTLQV